MDNEEQSVLKVLVELVDQVTEPLRTIQENMEAFESSIWSTVRSLGTAFAGFEALDHLIEPASRYEEVQAQLKMASDLGVQGLKELKEQAESLSETYVPSLEDVTAAQTGLYKIFHDMNTVKAATVQAAILATALNMKAADAARILGAAFYDMAPAGADVNQFMGQMADHLATLQTKFAMNTNSIQMMSTSLARTAVMGKSLGIDNNTMFALMGVLSNTALARRGVGQYLQMMFSEGVKDLKKYGLAVQGATAGSVDLMKTIQKISELSPKMQMGLYQKLPESAEGIVLLAEHLKDLQTAKTLFGSDQAAAAKDAAIQMDTLNAHLTTLHNTTKNNLDLWGTLGLPTFKTMTDQAKKLLVAFQDFSKVHTAIAAGIVDTISWGAWLVFLVGTIGTCVKAFGVLRSAVLLVDSVVPILGMLRTAMLGVQLALGGAATAGEALSLVFLSNPVGWIIAGLSALALAGYEAYKHWSQIESVINDVLSAMMKLDSIFGINDQKLFGLHLLSRGASPELSRYLLESSGSLAGRGGQSIHYNPQVTVNVAPGTDVHQAAQAFRGVLDENSSELMNDMAERQRKENRLTFQDTTNPYFAR